MSQPAPPPPTALTEVAINELVERYLLEMARYERAAATVAEQIRRELRAEARLRHLISFRAKHPEDLRGKLRTKSGKSAKYTDEALCRSLNSVVTDLAGVRIVVYAPEDEERVVALIDRKLVSANRPDARPEPLRTERGYRATHRLVLASQDDLALQGAICEVQVTTLAAHLFNELEHDITYKEESLDRNVSTDERACLREIRLVTDLADRHVERLLAAKKRAARESLVIDSAASLRFVLEQECGRPLSGDFVRLFRMLEASLDVLSPAWIVGMDPRATLSRGREAVAKVVAARGTAGDDLDDVTLFVAGLEAFRLEFKQLAASWRGPRTVLRWVIEELPDIDNEDQASQNRGTDA